MMRSAVRFVGVTSVLAGCGGSKGDASPGAGASTITLTYHQAQSGEGYHEPPSLDVGVVCPEDARVRLTRPALDGELRCRGLDAVPPLFHLIDPSETEVPPTDTIQATITTANGAQAVIEAPVELNNATWDWLGKLYTVRAPPGSTPAAGLRISGPISREVEGTGQVDGTTLRIQISGPASAALQIDDNEVVFTRHGDVSTGLAELDLGHLSAWTIQGDPSLQRDEHSAVVTLASGPVEDLLDIWLELADVATSVLAGPVWLVRPGGEPAENGIVVLDRRGTRRQRTKEFGSGKLVDLGVIVLESRGDAQRWTCKFEGHEEVHVLYGSEMTAYDPRTGAVVATRAFPARRGSCDRVAAGNLHRAEELVTVAQLDLAPILAWASDLVHPR